MQKKECEMAEKLFGIDLGGTKIEGIVLNLGEKIKPIFRERIPTERDKGYNHILNQLSRMVEMMSEAAGEKPKKIGIGTPGDTDPKTGLLRNSNTLCLNNQLLHQDFESRVSAPVFMANDANCFAFAEYHLGAVRKELPEARVSFGVIMGTGVGGGLVLDGKLWPGLHGIAGEWGHNFLDDSGGACYCGRNGCVEAIISGPSLEAYYTSLTGGKHLPLAEIIKHGQEEADGAAVATLDRMIHFFGIALGSVINLLDPEVIVLGGGLGNIDLLYDAGWEAVAENLFNNRMDTPLLKPLLGDSAGVFGAALLAAGEQQMEQMREGFEHLQ